MRNRGRVSKNDLNVVMNLLKEKFPQSKKYIFKKIPEMGKIVASNDFYDRIKTMNYVRNRYFSPCELFFISDEERIGFEKNIFFCAVKNAAKKYKEKCLFVANDDGLRGIKELLKRIINQP